MRSYVDLCGVPGDHSDTPLKPIGKQRSPCCGVVRFTECLGAVSGISRLSEWCGMRFQIKKHMLFCIVGARELIASHAIWYGTSEMIATAALICWRYGFRRIVDFHWFDKVYIAPAGSNKKCLRPHVFTPFH